MGTISESEKTASVQAIAEVLAEVMGGAWTVRKPNDYSHEILHADGHGCHVWWRDARLNISGVWPKLANGSIVTPSRTYNEPDTDITVSASRSVDAIARDIARRFMPGYLVVYNSVKARAQGQDDYEAKTQITLRDLRIANGQAANDDSRPHDQGSVYMKRSYAYQLTANGNSVRFGAFSCPVDVALKVLALLEKDDRTDD